MQVRARRLEEHAEASESLGGGGGIRSGQVELIWELIDVQMLESSPRARQLLRVGMASS
jgi:hypothetical protein